VESLSALFISPLVKKKRPLPPLFYHVIFFQKHGRRRWKIQRLIALFSGEELGREREINFPFYSTEILTLVTRSLKAAHGHDLREFPDV